MSLRRRSASRCVLALLAIVLVLPLVRMARADADHLVLTEVVVRERFQNGVQMGSPFIELTNPLGVAVSLDGVYLTTAQDITNAKHYWTVVGDGDSGGGSGGNFHGCFPAGMTLAAGDTVVIAVNGTTQFQAAYGFLPDLELFEDGVAPDQVPEMREVFWGSIGAGLGSNGVNVPTLSTTVESVMLYAWDGASDLVDDLDYVFYGTDTRARVDKTGVSVDGPDADEAPSTYAADTAVAQQHTAASTPPTFGRALARRTFAEDGEVVAGGNGLTGHDETSENLPVSWQIATSQNPARPPAVWYRTAPIVTEAEQVPLTPWAGNPVTLTARVLSHDALGPVVFHYRVNDGAEQPLVAAAGSGNNWTAQITGLAAEDTVRWWLEAQTTAGAATTFPFGGAARALTFAVTEPPTPGEGPAKLLFTEVCVTPSPGEFVEIYNPNAFAVPLADYYLTDAIYASGSQYYWRIVEGNPSQTTIGGGAYGDFHGRFPAEAVIAAGDTITVALMGRAAFEDYHLVTCDFELFADATGDTVPEMREVFPGSIGQPEAAYGVLTNDGEVVILYYWDGTTDLVTDIDMVLWGTGPSYRFSKNGVSIDGPDADTAPTTYAPETLANGIVPLDVTHAVGESFTRTDGTEGSQLVTGGNGVDGRDELSENWGSTFAVATASPAAPTSGVVTGGGAIALTVPARTFLPKQGEVFPIAFVANRNWQTRLRILDLQGRLVISLYDSAFDGKPSDDPANPERIAWDGRDQTYDQVRAGMYVVHLSVVNPESGDETVETAPVVVATRLQK